MRLIVSAGIVLALVTVSPSAQSASLKAMPSVSVQYYFNDNFYADDPDDLDDLDLDQSTATYIKYMVGLFLSYKQGQFTVNVNGDAGYSQCIELGGYAEDLKDDPSDFDSLRAKASASILYASSKFNFSLKDTIHRTRDLQEIFGFGTNELGYWSLYTNNIIEANLTFRPSGKSRALVSYRYSSLTFDEPENDVKKPVDSFGHRAIVRSEYDFSSKTTGIVDLQAINMIHEDRDGINSSDYLLYEYMGGLRFRPNPETSLEVIGGGATRQLTDLPDKAVLDLEEDVTSPVGRVTLNYHPLSNLIIKLQGEQGLSTYGRNIYFTYTAADLVIDYDVTPKVAARVSADYRHDVFDKDDNGRDYLWEEDRTDEMLIAHGSLNWDILQKEGKGTLILSVGYTYQSRDSSLDGPGDYVNPLAFPGSFDTIINSYFVQIRVLPTILIGD